jgi:DNA polymerase I-like protein with 3'-5' exonuclease and polymerase domains
MQNGTTQNKRYLLCETEEHFKELIHHIDEHEVFAYDTETTGLNVRSDKIIGIAVSGAVGVGYYLPTYVWNGAELQLYSEDSVSMAEQVVRKLLEKELVMHNASFDVRMTYHNYGVDLTPALKCDTIVLKHTVDEERPFGLKDIAKKIQGPLGLNVEEDANKEQLEMLASIKDNGGSTTRECYELYKADWAKIGIYACADVDLTLRIFNYYSDVLMDQGLEKFFYVDEVMPLLKHVTIPMEMKGVPVDLPGIMEAKETITVDIAKLEEEIQAKIKPLLPDFTRWFLGNAFPPRRTGGFAQALCAWADLPLPKTKSGRYSITNDALSSCLPNKYAEYLLGGPYLQDSEVEQIQLRLWEEAGTEHMFNLQSKHHLKRLFFNILGEKPINTTPKGAPQVDHLFLTTVKDKHDWVALLLDYNKLCKLRSAYIDRILEEQDGGVFYPRYQQHRTISGRYGSDLQQLPRPLEAGQASDIVIEHTNKIRKFFISGAGYKFIDADYESLEPHVFAHVSGDEQLKDIFRNNMDFYSTIAIRTEGLTGVSADKSADNFLGKVDKQLRQKAKAYSLGVPYGLEAFKLSTMLDNSVEECDELIAAYLDSFPQLKKWMEDSNRMCREEGYVKSEAGRVRHMKMATAFFYNPESRKILFEPNDELKDALELWKFWHPKKGSGSPRQYESWKWKRKQMKNFLNNAKNFQIQSLAASITNRACIAIARELKRQGIDGHVCAQIHDQIVVRVPEAEAEKWRKTVQYLMENSYEISLKLKAPAEISSDFYEGH